MRALPLLPLVSLLSACAGVSGLPVHPYSTGPLVWSECPPMPIEPGGQCSRNRVPLRWGSPGGAEIDVIVRRFRARETRAQLVMLDGGPGSTGAAFAAGPFFARTIERGIDLYVPTHRGTGRSTPLSCPAEQRPTSELGVLVSDAEQASCGASLAARYGDDLAGFTSYEAARDVAHLVARIREPGVPLYLWGGSYGSLWAQRVLEVAGDVVDGVILEGMVPLDASFEALGRNEDEAMRRLLAACAASAGCASHFDAEPVAIAEAVEAALEAGAGCDAVPDAIFARRIFARVFLEAPQERPLIAPILLRLARCSASDRVELAHLVARLAPTFEPTPLLDAEGTLAAPRLRGLVLGTNVMQLDLLHHPLALGAVEEAERGLLASSRVVVGFALTQAVWPRPPYAHPPSGPVSTAVPMLMFAGGFDAQTPWSWSSAVAASYDGPHQELVSFEHAGHMTYAYAWTDEGRNCAFELMDRFLDDPRAPLDRSCVDAVRRVDLDGTSERSADLAEAQLGVRAVWGTP